MEKKKAEVQFSIIWEVLRSSIWTACFVIVPFLYNLFVVIREEYLPKNLADKLQIRGLLFTIAWYWWVLGWLVILWLSTVLNASKKISQLRREIKDNSVKSLNLPNIIVGLSDENGLLSQKITLHIKPLPEKPDIEELIKQKRIKLEGKLQALQLEEKSMKMDDLKVPLNIPNLKNPLIPNMINFLSEGYPQKIDAYLSEYKIYLNNLYSHAIIVDRYKELLPIVENRSSSPASLVKLELSVQDGLPYPPNDKQIIKLTWKDGFSGKEPKEPEPFDIQRSIDFPWSRLGNELVTSISPIDREKEKTGHIEKQEGKSVYKYEIKDLIPFHLEAIKPIIAIWLESITQSTTFNIPVKIYAKELQPVEENIELDIILEKSE